jgi:Tol biopolymer transport system component
MLKFLLVIQAFVITLSNSPVLAQDPTDLYLFQLHKSSDQTYHVYHPMFLSGFNPNGYTNQPWFTREGNLLVSVRKAGEQQNDIYQLSPITKKLRRITETSTNEYSPRIHPDGQRLTVLRQIEGDPIDQQVFQAPLNGGRYSSLTPEMKNIGYYTWLGKDELALYSIDGENNSLEYLNLEDQRTRRITSSVGRTLWTDPNGAVVYVHKFASDYWYLKKYNPVLASIDIIAETPGLSEDFALAPDGTYFMGVGSKLYALQPSIQKTWQEVGDLSFLGITQITRMAISPDGKQLVLVSVQ